MKNKNNPSLYDRLEKLRAQTVLSKYAFARDVLGITPQAYNSLRVANGITNIQRVAIVLLEYVGAEKAMELLRHE